MKITPQIEFKSYLQGIKDIEKRNKAFKKLTDEEKRLEIAWDLLCLIKKEVIKPSSWLDYDRYWDSKLLNESQNLSSKDLQSFLCDIDKEDSTCIVCQRGGMMLSQIRLGNQISGSTYGKAWGESNIIKGFKLDDFRNMENEYERSLFCLPYEDNTLEKMANICCNVLVNGNFNTKDKTDYLK